MYVRKNKVMWRKWEKVRDRICGYAEGIYDGDWCGIGIGDWGRGR